MKVLVISAKKSKVPEEFSIRVQVGKEVFEVQAEVQLAQVGENQVQIVSIRERDKFSSITNYDRDILKTMYHLILEIYNGTSLSFPIILGEAS